MTNRSVSDQYILDTVENLNKYLHAVYLSIFEIHACPTEFVRSYASVSFLQGDTAVIFAYGETDGFSYHMSRRGAVGKYVLGGECKETTGVNTVQFLVRNASNSVQTVYMGLLLSTKLINCTCIFLLNVCKELEIKSHLQNEGLLNNFRIKCFCFNPYLVKPVWYIL